MFSLYLVLNLPRGGPVNVRLANHVCLVQFEVHMRERFSCDSLTSAYTCEHSYFVRQSCERQQTHASDALVRENPRRPENAVRTTKKMARAHRKYRTVGMSADSVLRHEQKCL